MEPVTHQKLLGLENCSVVTRPKLQARSLPLPLPRCAVSVAGQSSQPKKQAKHRRSMSSVKLAAVAQSLSCVRLSVTPWTVPARPLCPWDSPGMTTGVGCHVLLQGIFPTQGWNPCLLHCRWILYRWAFIRRPENLAALYNQKWCFCPFYLIWSIGTVCWWLEPSSQVKITLHWPVCCHQPAKTLDSSLALY